MASHLIHRDGSFSALDEDAQLDALILELGLVADDEHPDVAVSHESDWSIIAFPSGRVVLENVARDVGPGSPLHMMGVPRDQLRELFVLVAAGELGRLQAFDWQPGYGDATKVG